MNYWVEISCPYLLVYQDLLILVIYDKLLKLAIDKHIPRRFPADILWPFHAVSIFTQKKIVRITSGIGLPFLSSHLMLFPPILTGFLIPINGYDY